MSRHAPRLASLAALGLLICGVSRAANLVTNGTFDTGVVGWSADGDAAVVFDPADANGAPGSGSARVINSSPGPAMGRGIEQCAGTVAGSAYFAFGGKVLYPTGQARSGKMMIGLRWYNASDCTGEVVGDQPRVWTGTPETSWQALDGGTVRAHPAAHSVEFLVFPSKIEAGGTLLGKFDDLYVAVVSPMGDVNGDGLVNVQDVFYLINHLFAGGAAPIGSANVNGDGSVNVQDVFYLINYLFAGGPAPT